VKFSEFSIFTVAICCSSRVWPCTIHYLEDVFLWDAFCPFFTGPCHCTLVSEMSPSGPKFLVMKLVKYLKLFHKRKIIMEKDSFAFSHISCVHASLQAWSRDGVASPCTKRSIQENHKIQPKNFISFQGRWKTVVLWTLPMCQGASLEGLQWR
jgi:hypothetical protein